ncbi:IclR family transcriptional regulator [Natronorubrum texcoconense]|uniref:DNA-binding transcriptional regulator, IclR family n=1 Tax=Natronorubrum texcoconense TaxID=1095776 RepID=A0A1G9D0M7_9EURY|nr:IclR family transcriptional regulator [Natronorubrum texcoconense]SDK57481.1 DNA-binding transcriptional regulator, IclR family [Natronorubrum texcoconense]
MAQKSRIKSAETTLQILETIRELDGAGVGELSAELDRPTSTVHNYLQTLEQNEYLVKEDDTYRISLRFLAVGKHIEDRLTIRDIAMPEIDELAAQTGELASVLVEEHNKGIYAYLQSGDNALYLDAHPGMRTYLHQTGLGKAMLSAFDEERVDAVIDDHGLPSATSNTITGRDELKEELAEIRERGYAIDRGERVSGIRCVAVPITPSGDDPCGAISVSGPRSRVKGEFFEEELPQLVQEAADIIEINLRFS